MENLKTQSPNLIIAEFMGVRVYPEKNQNKQWVDIHTGKKGWKGEACDVHSFELKYDTSWDALMPVLHKFLSIPSETFNYHVSNMTALSVWKERINGLCISSEIEAVCQLITEAITWYLKTENPPRN